MIICNDICELTGLKLDSDFIVNFLLNIFLYSSKNVMIQDIF